MTANLFLLFMKKQGSVFHDDETIEDPNSGHFEKTENTIVITILLQPLREDLKVYLPITIPVIDLGISRICDDTVDIEKSD